MSQQLTHASSTPCLILAHLTHDPSPSVTADTAALAAVNHGEARDACAKADDAEEEDDEEDDDWLRSCNEPASWIGSEDSKEQCRARESCNPCQNISSCMCKMVRAAVAAAEAASESAGFGHEEEVDGEELSTVLGGSRWCCREDDEDESDWDLVATGLVCFTGLTSGDAGDEAARMMLACNVLRLRSRSFSVSYSSKMETVFLRS